MYTTHAQVDLRVAVHDCTSSSTSSSSSSSSGGRNKRQTVDFYNRLQCHVQSPL